MPTLGMFVIMALALAACETMNTISQRLSSIELPSLDGLLPGGTTAVAASDCPPIQVVPELGTLTEYSPMAQPSEKNLVSKVEIAEIGAACNGITKGNLSVDIAMILDGKAGPRARLTPDERPTFAYPYFVALTTTDGEILAKEIHAASMNYGKNQNAQSITEERTHIFPLNGSTETGKYRILVGFQLTDEQLAYNRTHPETQEGVPGTLVAAADDKNATQEAQQVASIAPAAGEDPVVKAPPPVPAHKPRQKTESGASDITQTME